jgi:voltage-gated potassium channel
VSQIRWPLAVIIASVVLGGLTFAVVEHVAIAEGLWFALVTCATVGYGDVAPHSPGGRLIAAAIILTSIPAVTILFARLTSWHVSQHALADVREAAQKAHKIAADLYRHHTGEQHPDAPVDNTAAKREEERA